MRGYCNRKYKYYVISILNINFILCQFTFVAFVVLFKGIVLIWNFNQSNILTNTFFYQNSQFIFTWFLNCTGFYSNHWNPYFWDLNFIGSSLESIFPSQLTTLPVDLPFLHIYKSTAVTMVTPIFRWIFPFPGGYRSILKKFVFVKLRFFYFVFSSSFFYSN
jgi:hypothetical protein